MDQKHIDRSAGFTLIEIGIIVPLLITSLLVVFSALFVLLKSSSIESASLNSVYDAQDALSTIERDATLTSQFLPTTETGIADAYKPTTNGSSWQYYGDSLASSTRVLILRSYATVENPQSNTRRPAYINNLGCGASTLYYNSVMSYNTIYFVKNKNLYRRIALNPSTSTCETPYQKQTCPSTEDLGGARDASCKADDELIATNVSDFSVTYYATPTSTNSLDVYANTANGTLVATAATVKVSITLSRTAYGTPVTYTASTTISKQNTSTGGGS